MPSQPLLEAARRAPAPVLQIAIPVRLIGGILIAIVAILLVSLASWSVDDPSLSYATTKPAQNWLGFPGAVIADITFQVFGLSILIALIPLALWGWNFVRRVVPSRMGWRVLAWALATCLGAGILSFIAAPESWPLPLGLGGLIGSGFHGIATMVTGAEPQPITSWLFGIIMAAPALVLFWIALGFGAVPESIGGV
jgi:S-DNA-T family DNA segregation ATPase FtsK/SpoIIIE